MGTAGDAEAQVARDRATESPVVALGRLVGDFRLQQRVPFVGGSLGEIADRSGDRVSSVERTLGAARHLDPFDIEQVRRDTVRADGVYAIHVRRHRQVRVGLTGQARADTANDGSLADLLAVVAELQTRNKLLDVVRVGHAELFDHLLGERGHGERHIEKAFFPFLRRDDDLFDVPVCGA